MTYPSFLWNEPLSECAESERKELIPENVIADLTLTGDMKNTSFTYLRQPCSAEEISARQGLFKLLIADQELRERLKSISRDAADLNRITGFYDRSEAQAERVIMFLPMIGKFIALAEKLAELEIYEGRAGEVGRYFRGICTSESFIAAETEYREMIKNRRPELLYTVRGNQVTASEGGTMTRARLEEYFAQMGVPEAIPIRKSPIRMGNAVAAVYAKVYYGFHAASERFFNKYKEAFTDGENDIRLTFAYVNEIGFLLDAAEYFIRLSNAGYPLAYPEVSDKREVVLNGIVDASLAKRELNGADVVPNDLMMTASSGNGEKLSFYIVTGANGGGKTTFVRACGIAVLFFLAGCPVTAASGRIYPFEAIYTHFPANESFENSGRFVNEANRAEEIIEKSTKDTFVVFNETYSGTDEIKSEQYSRRLAELMYERGVFGMFVTHIHSLTGGKIPTLAAVIDENDENRRTYKIKRVGATSSSFAADILEKYRLDREALQKRLDEMKLSCIREGGGTNVR